MFKKFSTFIILLFFSVTFLFLVGCFEDDEGGYHLVNGLEVIIISYANNDKLTAYSSVDGSVVDEEAIDSDGAASALAVLDNRIFVACRNQDSRFYVFNYDGEELSSLFEIDIATWASTNYDNPKCIVIVDATHGYISLMGQAGSTDGSIIEFNPTDYSFTREIEINEDELNNDNPTSIFYYNNKLYCTVYTMDEFWGNHGSYIYNVTDEEKEADLTIRNTQYTVLYQNFLYCSGIDQLEVYDLENGSSAVIDISGAGVLGCAGTNGFLAGGYDSTWSLVNKIWTFDLSSGTGELTELCSDWGG
ncbi:MAG: hypothetical protein SVR08_15875, partial [Spirochaetota bacterium]|nr:hypothetical protein [Spirochaetota bacterium]